MATFSSVPYVNASERMTEANSLVTQTASDNAFAEQLMQQSILGNGDSEAARQLMGTTRELMGLARINQQFWLEVAKGDKDQYKKEMELIKKS
ncbi:MAG: hypothetical protein ACOYK1_06675 [Vampirovibrionia bacterium]